MKNDVFDADMTAEANSGTAVSDSEFLKQDGTI